MVLAYWLIPRNFEKKVSCIVTKKNKTCSGQYVCMAPFMQYNSCKSCILSGALNIIIISSKCFKIWFYMCYLLLLYYNSLHISLDKVGSKILLILNRYNPHLLLWNGILWKPFPKLFYIVNINSFPLYFPQQTDTLNKQVNRIYEGHWMVDGDKRKVLKMQEYFENIS